MREKRWNKMKKKSLARVGINYDSSLLRNKRVKYQAYVYENYSFPSIHSSPILNGGYTQDGSVCIPIRYSTPPLPDKLLEYATTLHFPDLDSEVESDGEDSSSDESDEIDSDIDI